MIADRDFEIENFKKSKYYTVFLNENAEHFNPDGENIFEKKDVTERLVSELDGKIAKVISVTSKEKSENRPLLHSLTSLQKEANEKHGFTANDTLSALQNLYEKKLTTYPRTDSNYITEDMKNLMPKLVNEVSFFAPERCEKLLENGLNLDKRIIDDKKVTDHHAVLPTTETSKSLNMSLTETEKKVLNLVINRFLTALDSPYIFTETENIFDVCGYKFKSVTRLPKSLGWREYELSKIDKNGDIKPNTEDKIYNHGDSSTAKISITEKEKSAPRPFTESTLLSAMEHISRKIDDKEKAEFVKERGLGTPATRAGIIEKLVKDGFILRNGKNLNASELGKKIISLLPEEVKSVEMTANMKQKLFDVESGKLSASEYLKDVEEFIKARISAENGQIHTIFGNKNTSEILGKCPKCGKNVVSFPKSYSCEDRNCDFVIWKEMFGGKITVEDVKNILERGKTNTKNFKNKAGKAYKARLGLDVNKKIEISFVNSR
jgi:DNA topoisomerase-3